MELAMIHLETWVEEKYIALLFNVHLASPSIAIFAIYLLSGPEATQKFLSAAEIVILGKERISTQQGR